MQVLLPDMLISGVYMHIGSLGIGDGGVAGHFYDSEMDW